MQLIQSTARAACVLVVGTITILLAIYLFIRLCFSAFGFNEDVGIGPGLADEDQRIMSFYHLEHIGRGRSEITWRDGSGSSRVVIPQNVVLVQLSPSGRIAALRHSEHGSGEWWIIDAQSNSVIGPLSRREFLEECSLHSIEFEDIFDARHQSVGHVR
jgi:hypothetical protein